MGRANNRSRELTAKISGPRSTVELVGATADDVIDLLRALGAIA